MIVSMIAAMGSNRVIGKDNDLPWHLPDDFRFFQQTTKGHHVIMGRKNWESLPHKFQPLPHRTNLIVTRNQNYCAEGAQVISSIAEGQEIAQSSGEEELFIIGGGEIYRMALDASDRIYLTEIDAPFDGQVTFPEFPKNQWREVKRVHHPKDERHQYAFDFVVYEKN